MNVISYHTYSFGFYYYLTRSITFVFIIILFIIVSKWYNLRVRNNPINTNLIVADYFEKYINVQKKNTFKGNTHMKQLTVISS